MRAGQKFAEETVITTKVVVLLIAENPQGSSYLTERLQKHGCECEFATSFQQATSRIRTQDFDLVLSATRLHDGGAFPLMALLEGSGATLFYFHAVEEGCWWLPALRRGRRCFGSSALRPSDFVPVLDEVIHEIRLARCSASDFQLPSKQRSAVSILSAPSLGRESQLAGPTRPDTIPMKRKASG